MEKKRKKSWLVNFSSREGNKGLKNNPFHFIFFDTETMQKFTDKKIGRKTYKTCVNTLDMGWACYWNRETDEEIWCYFETIKEFHKFISKILTITKKQTLWIIAHNITFDNIITDIWSLFESKKYTSEFIHSKGMVYLQKMKLATVRKVKDKEGNVSEKKTTQKVVMLVNNGNIFPTSLKNIGETVNLPKLDIDFVESSREDMKIYCKRDVEILVKFWREWATFIETYKLGNLKYTISSQSMEAFKKKFCDSYVLLDDDVKNLSFERLSYYGGRTEIFHKGVVRDKIYYYDVNSMYPFVMSEYKYPTEFKFAKDNPSIENVKHLIDKGWLVVAECNIKTKRNCYPLKREGTLLFPTGKFTTYLSTPEVIKGMEYNDIQSFGRVSFYKGETLFKEYVDFFYNERLKKKAQGNKQERMLKLFLNSLYGKFGQMSDKWNPTTEEDIKIIDENFDFGKWIMGEYTLPTILVNGIDIFPSIRFLGSQLQMSGEKEESNISFPAIASHVTSYARLILWSVIEYCQKNKIKYYYCDTDSIFTSGEIAPEMVDENTLGKLKVEHIYEHGVEFINLKNYCELNEQGKKVIADENGDKIILDGNTFLKESKVFKGSTWKMKGISNNSEMIDENTFILQEWGGLPRQEYYKLFGRKTGEYWVIYKTKKNSGKINKGNLKRDGEISPFELNE